MRRPATAAAAIGLHLALLGAAWHAGLAPGTGPTDAAPRVSVLQVSLAPVPATVSMPVPRPEAALALMDTAAPAPPPDLPLLPLPAVTLLAPAPTEPTPSPAAMAPSPATASTTPATPAAIAAAAPPAPTSAPPVAAAAAPATAAPVQQAQVRREACPPATHPAALRERGIEGEVRLLVRVGTDGRAAEVKLQQPSGWRLFDQAALAQAQACRFVPARRGAQAEESWVEFPVRFSLQG